MTQKPYNMRSKAMANKQLREDCMLMRQANAAGQRPEVYLCRMLNQHGTFQQAAAAIGVTQGAIQNYLAHLPVTRLTSYKRSLKGNSPKAEDQWVPLWPESLILGMGK